VPLARVDEYELASCSSRSTADAPLRRSTSGSRERVVKERYARQDGHVFEGFALRWVDVDDDVWLRVRVGGHGHALD
jgi:hypothetical protein